MRSNVVAHVCLASECLHAALSTCTWVSLVSPFMWPIRLQGIKLSVMACFIYYIIRCTFNHQCQRGRAARTRAPARGLRAEEERRETLATARQEAPQPEAAPKVVEGGRPRVHCARSFLPRSIYVAWSKCASLCQTLHDVVHYVRGLQMFSRREGGEEKEIKGGASFSLKFK